MPRSLEQGPPRRPSALKRAVLPLALGIATAAAAGGQHFSDRRFHPVSNTDQTAFTSYYGHLPLDFPNTSMETGQIAHNFKPAAGWGEEYTEVDIGYLNEQFQEIRNAGFDGIKISFHGINDVRDKGSRIYTSAMQRCDSKFPGIKYKLLVERLANTEVDNSEVMLDKIMEYFWEHHFNNPHYYWSPEGPEVDFFTGDNQEWVDNIQVTEILYRLEEDWGINAVRRSAFGDNIVALGRNKYDSEIDEFHYGFEPHQLRPSGLDITEHEATVTGRYRKLPRGIIKEEDHKIIFWNADRARQNIREARDPDPDPNSDSKIVAETFTWNSFNEGPEFTYFTGEQEMIDLLGEELYDPGDDILHGTFPAPCTNPQEFDFSVGSSKTGETVIVSFPTSSPTPLREAA